MIRGNRVNFYKLLSLPKVYKKSPNNIWTSKELSDLVLQSYLRPEIPGGSLNENQINSNVEFIKKHIDEKFYKKGLDIGCGIGNYCEKLSDLGYNMEGIDISRTAINYAQNKKRNNINYINKDIFKYHTKKKYDFILLLYGTYSTFDSKQRRNLLKKTKNLMNNNGKLILDVPNIRHFKRQNELSSWDFFTNDNSYSHPPFFMLFSIKKYDNNILLNRSIYIFENNKINIFYEWIKNFTKKEIINELKKENCKIKYISENIYSMIHQK
ncbi:class I SAM-dependent methyltransferase [Staphylococcus cohnii]|nr:class I SAM-dependent methyltransferase [Staphylococcus cohnii]